MKPTPAAICGYLAGIYCSWAAATPPAAPELQLQRIDRDKLCVTNGVVTALPDGRLAIDTPSSRAVVRMATAQSAEIRFRYLGPTQSSKPLASGELRRQIGLKLRAQDTCNLLYVMWHIEPDSRIAVSLKRNTGMHLHAQCDAHGYENIKPRKVVALPQILPGESHSLRVDLRGTNLTLVADGRVVWEGIVGDRVAEIDGPVGLRTDNARFAFDYYAAASDSVRRSGPVDESFNRCLQSPGD